MGPPGLNSGCQQSSVLSRGSRGESMSLRFLGSRSCLRSLACGHFAYLKASSYTPGPPHKTTLIPSPIIFLSALLSGPLLVSLLALPKSFATLFSHCQIKTNVYLYFSTYVSIYHTLLNYFGEHRKSSQCPERYKGRKYQNRINGVLLPPRFQKAS